MKSQTALVLFDIDGTLLRGATQHHKQALIDGIHRATGLATHLEGIATAGMLDRDIIVAMLRAAKYTDRRARRALRRIADACATTYVNSCSVDLRPFVCPGVAEFLDQLRTRGSVLGIVSGNLSSIGWRKIELAGLLDYFSVGAFAEHGTTRSRLARVCVQRARKAGLVDKNSPVTLIGDHSNDVLAAKANGYRSVAVATGITSMEDLQQSNPDYLVRDLTELPPDAVL